MPDVVERLRTAAAAVLPTEPVAFAYLFGSHAAGTAAASSDIDVAIHLTPAAAADELDVRLRLAGALERTAGVGPVEVAVLDDATLSLAGRVQENHRVLYRFDEVARVRYESLVARTYHDFKIHEARAARERLARLAGDTSVVDAGRVSALLQRIREELDHLRLLHERDDEELLADPDALPATKYRLIVAIEAAIDAADHIIAADGLRPSASFADSFESLHEGGWLDAELASALSGAARLRNLLVHQYAEVDDRRVLEIVRTRLSDLDAFVATVAKRLG